MSLKIRVWSAIPSVFEDLIEGLEDKPQAEILLDPAPLSEDLSDLTDQNVNFAVIDGERVLVAFSMDAYFEECPADLVEHIPTDAFENYKKATQPMAPFFGAAD